MMQLCVCKEGGRRNRGGNRSRSLGHQPAVEPATLPPTAPSSLTLFLHPSTPFVPPVRAVGMCAYVCVTFLRTSRRASRNRRLALPSSSSNNVNSRVPAALIMLPPPATMFTARELCAIPCPFPRHFLSCRLPAADAFSRADFAYDASPSRVTAR